MQVAGDDAATILTSGSKLACLRERLDHHLVRV